MRSQHLLPRGLQDTSLLDLHVEQLTYLLGFVALDGPGHLASAQLACRTLRQAGEAVPRGTQLVVNAAKLQRARATGHEEQLLAFLTRAAHLWQEATVEILSPTDLPVLLGCLAARDGGGGLRSLELRFGEQDDSSVPSYRWVPRYPGQNFELPQELEQLTSLTALSLHQLCIRRCVRLETYAPGDHLPAPSLARLSSLTALQSLALECMVEGPIPHEAFSTLCHLTSLDVTIPTFRPRGNWDEEWVGRRRRLGSQHLATLTALRCLRLAGVEPHLPPPLAVMAWQHLEELELLHLPDTLRYEPGWGSDADLGGVWTALPLLPCLTHLVADGVEGFPSVCLSFFMPARLSTLRLGGFSQPALPPLPPSLTALSLGSDGDNGLLQMPVSPGLRSLGLWSTPEGPEPEWPDSTSTMVQLTSLCLYGCVMSQFPASLARLPALEKLELGQTMIPDLPDELACVGTLRFLGLSDNGLSRVPRVLGGGAASRLEHLDMRHNFRAIVGENGQVDETGLGVLRSLTALTYLKLERLPKDFDPGIEVLRKALAAAQYSRVVPPLSSGS